MRNRKYQRLYLQLNEAMECLEHIFTEGCTHVGPHDMEPHKKKGPCTSFSTCCRGLQLLIRHFVTCKKKVPGGCSHCKRMWQLFRLHSSLCDQPESCKVPLCRYVTYTASLFGLIERNESFHVNLWAMMHRYARTQILYV